MDEITENMKVFKAKDGNKMDFYEAKPKEFKSTIIVVSEIWGLSKFLKSFSKRLAQEGYRTLAPDLYSRPEDREIFTEENIMDAMRPMWSLPPEKRRDPKAMEEAMTKLSPVGKKIFESVSQKREEMEKRMISDLEDIYELEMGKEGGNGIVGFCLGGGLAFQLSTMKHFDASVIFYGATPRNAEEVKNIKGAIFGIYAGEDSGINATVPDLMKKVIEYKTNFEMKLYPGTFHAFFNDTGMSYHKEASEDAWERVKYFYRRNLA
jgi:carboxymethylenebutenolidase